MREAIIVACGLLRERWRRCLKKKKETFMVIGREGEEGSRGNGHLKWRVTLDTQRGG